QAQPSILFWWFTTCGGVWGAEAEASRAATSPETRGCPSRLCYNIPADEASSNVGGNHEFPGRSPETRAKKSAGPGTARSSPRFSEYLANAQRHEGGDGSSSGRRRCPLVPGCPFRPRYRRGTERGSGASPGRLAQPSGKGRCGVSQPVAGKISCDGLHPERTGALQGGREPLRRIAGFGRGGRLRGQVGAVQGLSGLSLGFL